jgi:hypothetical protein
MWSRMASQVLAGTRVAAFRAGVLDQVVRGDVAVEPTHAGPCWGECRGGAVQLAGGIGQGLLEPVVRRLGLLLAGAVARCGRP